MKPTRRERQRGAAAIWVALVLGVLVTVTGLALDTAQMIWAGQELQIAADASALAGARYARDGEEEVRWRATYVAQSNTVVGMPLYMDYNFENAPDGDVVIGRFDRDTGAFTATLDSCNAVKAVARRTDSALSGPLPLFFCQIFGVESVNIQRQAIAMIGGGTGGGLICLDPTARNSLDVSGNVTLRVDGGEVQVNSTHNQCSYFGGNIAIEAGSVNMCGDYRTVGGPTLPDSLNTGVDPIADPLAHIPEPTWNPADDLGTISNSSGDLVLTPGYYSGGISALGGTITLEPGIYILDGAGLDIGGNASFQAEGCMFFVTGTGAVDFHGTGDLLITPPDPEVHSYPDADVYEGIGIFQSRSNTSAGNMIGTSVMDLQGSYYFPSNHMSIGGNATKFGNQLVVGTLEVFGNGTLTINYDGRFPSPGHDVFLVV